jgi:preprotein translocase subunit SecF
MRFIANRKKFYIVSGVFFIISLFVFLFVPKNYGIDMTGGLQMEYSTTNVVTPESLDIVRSDIAKNYTFNSKAVISDVLIYIVNTDSIRVDV